MWNNVETQGSNNMTEKWININMLREIKIESNIIDFFRDYEQTKKSIVVTGWDTLWQDTF